MGMELVNGQTGQNMKGIGKKGREMDKGNKTIQIKLFMKESGNRDK